MPQVLIVDDEPQDLKIWSRAFEEDYGWAVTRAAGVAEALAYLGAAVPDVVLLDRRMPDPKNPGDVREEVGDELLEHITAHWPDVAVIMLTHIENIQAAQHATRFGAYRYFWKRTPTQEVERACRMAIRMQQIKRARRTLLALDSMEEVVKEVKRLSGTLVEGPGQFIHLEVAPGGSLRLVWPELSGPSALVGPEDSRHPFVRTVPCVREVLDSRQYRLACERSQLHPDGGTWAENSRSQLIVPVLEPDRTTSPAENRVSALLWVESPREGAFDKELAEALLALADYIGDAYAKGNKLQKQIEQTQKEANDGLLLDVAHEICNPLQVAQSNLDLLLARTARKPSLTPDEEDLQKRLSGILTGLEDAIRAAVDLRYNTIERELDVKECDLAGIVSEVVKAFDARMVSAGCRLLLDPAPTLPRVRLDERAMRDALRCLLENALEAITEKRRRDDKPQEPGEVVVSLVADPSGQGDVQLSVTDSGCGIESKSLPRLFERYFSTKERDLRGGRRGIGLYQIARFVRRVGGIVEAHNAPKGGAELCIVFPAAGAAPRSVSGGGRQV